MRSPVDLDFISPDVAGPPSRLGPRVPALVAEVGHAAAIGAPGDRIYGGAAGQEGVGEGRAAVILQGPEEGIDTQLVGGSVGQPAAPIAN